MKAVKILVSFMVTLAMLLAIGCTGPSAPSGESPGIRTADTPTSGGTPASQGGADTSDPLSQEPDEDSESSLELGDSVIPIDISYATDVLLSNLGDYDEFLEDYTPLIGYETDERIVISTDSEVEDFKFIELSTRSGGDGIEFFEKSVLHSQKTLSPDKPLVVTWQEIGSTPHRGLSFTDGEGNTRYCLISASGKDNSLLLTEF